MGASSLSLIAVLTGTKGTFGPVASAFNTCALAVHWRVEIPSLAGANEGVLLLCHPIDGCFLVAKIVVSSIALCFRLCQNCRHRVRKDILLCTLMSLRRSWQ